MSEMHELVMILRCYSVKNYDFIHVLVKCISEISKCIFIIVTS